ncbi:TolC family protein [Candidatus Methylocalor cossyra]|uniref:Outer membrane protein TolC n=1 Tax=Candidatus Methylocalor cossyra TaxID=3108543 RepID=A0ABP1C8B2_9GAMM
MNLTHGLIGVLYLLAATALRAEDLLVEHRDELVFDERLSLKEVVDATFEKYPKNALIAAFEDEARALEQRTSSWIAGYPFIYVQWLNDAAFGSRGIGNQEVQSGYQIPFWMWDQHKASRRVTDEARKSAELYARALRHEVAGLVRDALWNLRLVENRYQLARQIYEVAERLTEVVRRRVELGDLARADLLLAESDQLDKKTALLQAEAEVMHARKAYENLTRLRKAPAHFAEPLSPRKGFDEQHPAVAAANALVARAQAEVDFTRHSKQGNQPALMLGTDHSRNSDRERFNNGTNIAITIPIGGDDWNAPYVAQANVVLTERITQRETLWRQLERALHEARHNLEVDRAALEIAQRRKEIAETQIRMSRLAFETGEIALIDYLKIQSGAQAAIRDAAQRAIQVQRDTAVYNQVVGVTP